MNPIATLLPGRAAVRNRPAPVKPAVAVVVAAVVALGLPVLGLAGSAGPAAAAASQHTEIAVADTVVKSGAGVTNFGRRSRWAADATSGRRRQSLVRFSVNAPAAGHTITSATLRARAYNGSNGAGIDVSATGNAWSETGATWRNAPATGAWLHRKGGYLRGSWVTWNVTAGIPSTVRSSGGDVSFKLTTTQKRWLAFHARESGSRPQLTVTTAPTTGTATPSPTPTPAAKPAGVPGSWTQSWGDEFAGPTVDAAKWNFNEGKVQNGVTNRAANVTAAGGSAVLTLASSSSGAMLTSGVVDGWGTHKYTLPVGGYAEARIYFPGDGGTTINNWPAWWAVGDGWPGNGENDIAEGLEWMTVNYHSTTVNTGWHIPGSWSNAYHVYGLHRRAGRSDVYYDGVLVKSYPTADPGSGQALVLNLGHGYGPAVFGPASQVKVDYVRAFSPR